MNYNEIGKAGIIGGVVIIVVEFILGAISMSLAYDLSFILMLVVAAWVGGWMTKKTDDAVAAGVLAAIIYVVLGLYILFPAVSSYRSASPLAALVIMVVLGAIGGFAGQYLASHGSTKSSMKKM